MPAYPNHQDIRPAYVTEIDPGAVGAGVFWFKASTGSMSVRNLTDTGWDAVAGSPGVAGVGRSGPPGMAAEEAETPMVIPGMRGRAGKDGKTRFIPLAIDDPEPSINIPGKKGTTGAPGAGGSGASGTAVLGFGAFPGASDALVAVIGQATIIADSIVRAWVRPVATADHSADEHLVETINVIAGNIIAGTGFTIYGFNTSEINEPVAPLGAELNPEGWLATNRLIGATGIARGGGRGTRIYGQWTVAWQWS